MGESADCHHLWKSSSPNGRNKHVRNGVRNETERFESIKKSPSNSRRASEGSRSASGDARLSFHFHFGGYPHRSVLLTRSNRYCGLNKRGEDGVQIIQSRVRLTFCFLTIWFKSSQERFDGDECERRGQSRISRDLRKASKASAAMRHVKKIRCKIRIGLIAL